MKKNILIALLTFFSMGAYATVTAVATNASTSVTATSATGNSFITTNNSTWILEDGFLVSTSSVAPTFATMGSYTKFSTTRGAGIIATSHAFSQAITGLACGNKYYVWAFSSDASPNTVASTVFAPTADIIDLSNAPVFSNSPITKASISTATTTTTLTAGVCPFGAISSEGVTWNTTGNPVITTDPFSSNGTSSASYSSTLTGLSQDVLYYVRPYVVIGGTAYYGPQINYINYSVTNAITIFPKWRFGNNAGIDFNYGIATPTAASQNLITAQNPEASTSACDTTDALVLHTDTRRVNSLGAGGVLLRDIELTDNIAAGSATQGGVSIPDPASPFDTYYLFTANDISGGSKVDRGINYWKFKKTAGVTSYLSGPTNVVGSVVDESLTAVPDGFGNYWLLSHDKSTTEFCVWKITASGISAVTKYAGTGTATPTTVPANSAQSCIRVNQCINKVAWGRGNQVRVHNFDQATGVIGLAPVYANPGGTDYLNPAGLSKPVYQVEFAPKGNRLYVSCYSHKQLIQIDLAGAAGNGTLLSSDEFWGLQLGPNGNLYASGRENTNEYYEITSADAATPTITVKTLSAGTSQYRGISNLPLIGGTKGIQAGGILKKVPTNCRDFMFGFKYYNYNNDPVTITGATWTFTSKVAPFGVTQVVTTAPYTDSINYILPANNAYDVYVTVTDAYCGTTHKSAVFVVTPNCPAPVQFINISATSQSGSTKIFWSTAMEINSAAFVIQRSIDGKDFVTIGSVPAAGNSRHIKNYSFTDENPHEGKVFYRVIEIDTDGSKLYSSVVSTNSESDGKIYTISNNPFKNEFSLNIIGEQDISITIFDASGKLVYENKIGVVSGSVSLGADLSSGAYILEIIDNITGKAYRDKLIKY